MRLKIDFVPNGTKKGKAAGYLFYQYFVPHGTIFVMQYWHKLCRRHYISVEIIRILSFRAVRYE